MARGARGLLAGPPLAVRSARAIPPHAGHDQHGGCENPGRPACDARYAARVIIVGLLLIFVVLFVLLPLLGLAIWALISTAVIGLVMGSLGRLLVPGRQSIGLFGTMLLGLVGSIVGGFVGNHVMHLDRVLTVLLEIGTSAALVAIVAAVDAVRLTHGNQRYLDPGR